MKNGYFQVRFNLTMYEANASIMREIESYKKELISKGITDYDHLVKKKLKELDDFWFTWVSW